MRFAKFAIALALFVTSVSFQEQVLMTKNGIDVTWKTSITTSQSFALQQEAAFESSH